MVNVIAHRGWWHTPDEQNTLTAFARAFDAGIGVELDVRDWNGELVVSHDPPFMKPADIYAYAGCSLTTFSEVLELLGDRPNVLAVNVKSCGLAPLFAKLRAPANWFFFDLPPYEYREYKKYGLIEVSPAISNELFGCEADDQWKLLKEFEEHEYLITDRVTEAMEFFK